MERVNHQVQAPVKLGTAPVALNEVAQDHQHRQFEL